MPAPESDYYKRIFEKKDVSPSNDKDIKIITQNPEKVDSKKYTISGGYGSVKPLLNECTDYVHTKTPRNPLTRNEKQKEMESNQDFPSRIKNALKITDEKTRTEVMKQIAIDKSKINK